MRISWEQALAWRLRRHFLTTPGATAVDVVRRLGGVPAWSGDPDLAVRRRLDNPAPDAVARAWESGDIVKTYAFRGATHLLAADRAGVTLAVRAAGRQWLLSSWRSHYGLEADDWDLLRRAVRAAVGDGPIGWGELVDRVCDHTSLSHLREHLADRSHTLLKPLAWQGDLCFAPSADGETTFTSPALSPRWAGVPDLEEAGPQAVLDFLGGYGPATRANLEHWLLGGLSAGRRRLAGWLDALTGDTIVEVDVDGTPALMRADLVDELCAFEADAEAVTLLAGHDQWVMGPGTDDERIVPPELRPAVSKGANLVLLAGRVGGTWRIRGDAVEVTWAVSPSTTVAERVPAEVSRLSGLVDVDLSLVET